MSMATIISGCHGIVILYRINGWQPRQQRMRSSSGGLAATVSMWRILGVCQQLATAIASSNCSVACQRRSRQRISVNVTNG